MIELTKQLEQLTADGTHLLLTGALHGIEKEGLRVTDSGQLAQTPHPESLGSALTNSHITTDFSEALIELITPVFTDTLSAIGFLEDLHRFTYRHIGDELLWAGSMPCHLADPALIPLARYGSSNIGTMKHVYRVGLKHRYGTLMQSIAGIHYNFSLPDEFWPRFQDSREDTRSLQTFRSSSYFKLIRNFRRHSWLLLYLFGASPALDLSFLRGRPHDLHLLHDQTGYLPHATSLRMSDLGYSTTVQATLNICFNHLDTYIDSLVKAVQTPYPPYEKIGIKVDGEYRQLSDTILQIENEHYSDVRPKRVAAKGERPLEALKRGGVEYIEIRCIDVNPFLPVGLDMRQALFLDTFLLSCLLLEESEISTAECRMVQENLQKVITRGREPNLLLNTSAGAQPLSAAGNSLLDRLQRTAELLDEVHETTAYTVTVEAQREKLDNVSLTPSARVLEDLRQSGLEYDQWILLKSREHRETLGAVSPRPEVLQDLALHAAASIQAQHQLEAEDTQSFDEFIGEFLALEMNG